MINPKHNPVEWTLLIDELMETHEHLGALISKLGKEPEYDEEWYRVDMGEPAHGPDATARATLLMRNASDFESIRKTCLRSPDQR